MAAARPLVSVYTAGKVDGTQALPAVFTAPIRSDIVQFVHTNMRKNKRQAYAVALDAGHQTSAESWGTGRAVSRIPRVAGGGTSRSGQGAFGNMCRGGRMFAPTKVWRKWHKKINQNQRRYAVASALAASAVPALVMARGHDIEDVVELPLVLNADAEKVDKTKAAIELLKSVGAYDDVEKAAASKKVRRGKGKMRNRRYRQRRGPLVIYNNDAGIVRAFRNLPGVELCQVDRLNLLTLAPGGHLGRFCVFTAPAFARLDEIFGTYSQGSQTKTGYSLPKHIVTNGDLERIINSDAVQSKLRPAIKQQKLHGRKKNPLKNLGVMVRLNPYAVTMKRTEMQAQATRAAKKAALVDAKRKGTAKDAKEEAKKRKVAGRKFFDAMMEDDFSEESEYESSSEEEEEEDDEE